MAHRVPLRNKLLAIVALLSVAACNEQKKTAVVLSSSRVMRLPYYTSADFEPHWLTKNERVPDSIHRIAKFSFPDQNGNTVSSTDVQGKIYVANFFFTSCRGICPKLTGNLKIVSDSIGNMPGLLFLSHTVMPDADDIAALKHYATAYGIENPDWHLLTGDKKQLYTLARQSYFADDKAGMDRSADEFLHTENILLIDKQGHIRGIYKGTSQLEMFAIIDDIKILEKE